MFIVGLTGGVATGKSTVAKMFLDCGAVVLNADYFAKKQLWRTSPVFTKIVKTFGEEILVRGRINRERLAAIVFSQQQKRKELEAIVHPMVKKEILGRIASFKKNKHQIVIIEVPLLFEVGWDAWMDQVVVVKITKKNQIERAVKSLRCDSKHVLARIQAQMPLSEKVRKADFMIDNSNSRKETRKKVVMIWEKLQLMAKR